MAMNTMQRPQSGNVGQQINAKIVSTPVTDRFALALLTLLTA